MYRKITVTLFCIGFISLKIALSTVSAVEEKALPPGEGADVVTADKAEEPGPTASASISFMSQYIWRGYELSKDSLVIQPALTVGYRGFSLNLWGNLDTDVYSGPYKGDSKWNETDFTFCYETNFGPVGIGAGYIYYALDSLDDSQEFYLSVGVDTILSPTITVYREVSKLQGWYIDLGISHSFELPRDITLDLAASAAYYISDNDTIVDYDNALNPTSHRFDNFQNGLITAGITVPFYKYFTVVPMIGYSFPLGNRADNLLKATSLSNSASHFFGGVTFSLAF